MIFKTSLLSLLLVPWLFASAETITLTNGEWAPYMGKKIKEYGISSFIVTRAFEKEGITVKFKWYPWKRAMKKAKEGTFHGTLVWKKNKEH